jgi:hypothetical protein
MTKGVKKIPPSFHFFKHDEILNPYWEDDPNITFHPSGGWGDFLFSYA